MKPRFPTTRREPDFEQFLRVCRRETPDRPVLYEHYIEWPILQEALGDEFAPQDDPPWGWVANIMNGYARLGHDCAPLYLSALLNFAFPVGGHEEGKSLSQNSGALVHGWDDLDSYPWPDPDQFDLMGAMDRLAGQVPGKMKLLLYPPRGIWEVLVDLIGFDELCFALVDDPDFVAEVTRRAGTRIARWIELGIRHEIVGGLFVSDDLGFKSSTMVSPDLIRQYILPWHRKLAGLAKAEGKIAVLHCCGKVECLMDDFVAAGYDAKHSYEDVICPVEEIYSRFSDRLGILGGLDVDYLSRSTPGEIGKRVRDLVEATGMKGYAIGSGNSLTAEMPAENIAALLEAARVC